MENESEEPIVGEDGKIRNAAGEELVAIIPPHGMEMQEFLTSNTFCAANSCLQQRNELRSIMRDHRFMVITWLAQNGVAIPLELAADNLHAQVGHQKPDQPTKL
jgi:hypothetical protein